MVVSGRSSLFKSNMPSHQTDSISTPGQYTFGWWIRNSTPKNHKNSEFVHVFFNAHIHIGASRAEATVSQGPTSLVTRRGHSVRSVDRCLLFMFRTNVVMNIVTTNIYLLWMSMMRFLLSTSYHISLTKLWVNPMRSSAARVDSVRRRSLCHPEIRRADLSGIGFIWFNTWDFNDVGPQWN